MLFWGKVRQGDKRGRKLGYPTANTAIHKKLDEGVYVSLVRIPKIVISSIGEKSSIKKEIAAVFVPLTSRNDGEWHPALTFIGSAKTFGKNECLAETYILDFQGNLYDRFVTIKLLKKLRGNKKFDSAKSLISQMKRDEKEAREFFKKTRE